MTSGEWRRRWRKGASAGNAAVSSAGGGGGGGGAARSPWVMNGEAERPAQCVIDPPETGR